MRIDDWHSETDIYISYISQNRLGVKGKKRGRMSVMVLHMTIKPDTAGEYTFEGRSRAVHRARGVVGQAIVQDSPATSRHRSISIDAAAPIPGVVNATAT